MEPHAALAVHDEPAVVGTPMRHFSKILLQSVQHGHWDTIVGAERFVVKNAAHGNMNAMIINNEINSLNWFSKKYKYNDITISQYHNININIITNAAHSRTIL